MPFVTGNVNNHGARQFIHNRGEVGYCVTFISEAQILANAWLTLVMGDDDTNLQMVCLSVNCLVHIL